MNDSRLDDYTFGQIMCSIQAMALRVDQSGNSCFADENALMPVAGVGEKLHSHKPIPRVLTDEILRRIPEGIDLDNLKIPCEFEIELEPWESVNIFIEVRIVPVKGDQQSDGFVIFCHDITDLKKTGFALEQKNSSLELLISCTNIANRASEFRLALSDCMDIICSFENWLYKGWLVAHAYIVDDEDVDSLVSSNIWICQNPARIKAFVDLTMRTPLRKGLGIPGRVFESGEPIWHGKKPSYSELPRARLADECGLFSVVAIPVVSGERVVAVIELFADDERPPNDQMLNVLVAVGRELGSVYSREKTNQQIRFMADHDGLTGLVVTRVLRDRLSRVLASITRNQSVAALLFIDLDGFKLVNDTYGHDIGDELIVHVSAVLTACVREVDTVCRFGGDEFIILLSDINSEEGAVTVAEKILGAFKVPVKMGVAEVKVGASIGITVCSDARLGADAVISAADSAMYQAKNSGKNRYIISPDKG